MPPGEPTEHVVECPTEAATRAVGARLASALRAGDLVALHGELGAGKTRFVMGMAEGLGVDPALVSSPTFVLMNEYAVTAPAGAAAGIEALVHADVYRLPAGVDLEEVLGLDDRLVRTSIVVVEWAERLGDGLAPTVEVFIAMTPGGGRRVRIRRHGGAGPE